MKFHSPEIRVTLWPQDDIPELVGQEYCAIVMDYDSDQKTWFNTGIVVRAGSPESAFLHAMTRYSLEVYSNEKAKS